MDIKTRPIAKYLEMTFKYGNATIETGVMDFDEQKEMAKQLKSAYEDINSHLERWNEEPV